MASDVMRGVVKIESGLTVHAHSVAADVPRADAAAIVMIHAGGAMSLQWKGVLEALGGRWDAAALDLHGVALTTSWPATGETRAMEVEDEARLVLEYCRTVYGARPIHLIGHSYGASVALRAALEDEGRFASLTIYELQSPALNARLAPGSAGAQWVHESVDRFLATMDRGDIDQAMSDWTDTIVFPGFWRKQDAATRQRMGTVAVPGVLQMRASQRDRTTLADMTRLALPLLLVVGGASPLRFREPTDALHRLRRQRSALVSIDGAAHLAPQTHAAAFASALEAHLAAFAAEPLRAVG